MVKSVIASAAGRDSYLDANGAHDGIISMHTLTCLMQEETLAGH